MPTEIIEISRQGPPGPGNPLGGLTGQVLAKKSDQDHDTGWVDQSGGGGGGSAVRFLPTNTTLYVRADGNDANDGADDTPERALLTIDKANAVASGTYSGSNQALTLIVGPGTYVQNDGPFQRLGVSDQYLNGTLSLIGPFDPGTPAILGSSLITRGASMSVNRFNLSGGVYLDGGCVRFENCNISGIVNLSNGAKALFQNCTFSLPPASYRIFTVADRSDITLEGCNFSSVAGCDLFGAFLAAERMSYVKLRSLNFAGAAITGKKYTLASGSLLDFDGSDSNVPGDVAGTIETNSLAF